MELNLVLFFFPEIDNEGVIEPDNDDPQEMGDENLEVSTVFLMSVAAGKMRRGFESRVAFEGVEYYTS